jgi:uncharacterized protein (DUF362 family)
LNYPITRRDFIKGTVSALLGMSVGAGILGCEGRPLGFIPATRVSTDKSKSTVVLVRNEKALDQMHVPVQPIIDEMVSDAIQNLASDRDAIKAWKRFIKPSDTVGIKTNDMMVATHLEVVEAIVKNLHAIGVADERIIIWDQHKAGVGFSGIRNRNRRFGFNRFKISKIVTEHCTALINVPGVKTHCLAGVSVALKNWVGAVTNINTKDLLVTYPIHGDCCAEVCSINAMPVIRDKCRLIIADALRPLFHGGPQPDPKYMWDYKGLLMSTDPVAIDIVALKIVQEKRNQYKGRDWPISPPAKHVQVADHKYGLGNSDWDWVELTEKYV